VENFYLFFISQFNLLGKGLDLHVALGLLNVKDMLNPVSRVFFKVDLLVNGQCRIFFSYQSIL